MNSVNLHQKRFVSADKEIDVIHGLGQIAVKTEYLWSLTER